MSTQNPRERKKVRNRQGRVKGGNKEGGRGWEGRKEFLEEVEK